MKVENLIPNVSVLKQTSPNKNKRIYSGEYLFLGKDSNVNVPIRGFLYPVSVITYIIQKYDKESSTKLVGPMIAITEGELESLYEEVYRVDIN